MSFAQIDKPKQFTNQKRTEFLSLPQGRTVIRVLDDSAYSLDTHYVNKFTIACLGEDCPICANNRKIISENPETFRDVAGYLPRQTRFFVNVLDRTVGRVCPSCNTAVKVDSAVACTNPKCNQVIADVERKPLNRVVVLSKGKTLFEQLNSIEESVLDDEGNQKSLTSYDIVLAVNGTGRQQTITPIPNDRGEKNETFTIPEEDKFNLSEVTVKLTVDEIFELLKGVTIRDIFSARKLTKKESDVSETHAELVKDARDQLNEMFNN